jgi:hypothetical protein
MSGPSTRLSAFSSRTLGIAIAVVAIGVVTAYTAYRARRYPCVSHERGLRGEAMRTADGKMLYFNGDCWTRRPMPPTDTPF